MKSAEFLAGVIGSMFGGPRREALHGDLMRSVGVGLAPPQDYGKNRWRPNGHTTTSQISLLSLSGAAPSKELFVVASDHHSRSRYGNQRP